MSEEHRYHPFYCEENAWWLCQDELLRHARPDVVFVTNHAKQCLLLEQRAAEEGEPVLWDYHVLVIANGEVWDLDSRLGMPVPLATYLDKTFPSLPEHLQHLAPMFRCMSSDDFLAKFLTDRAHMRNTSGWIKPPPPWPAPGVGTTPNQLRFIDLDDDVAGEIVDLASLRARYSR